MAVRYSQIQINMGEVIATHKSDPLDIPFTEALETIRANARNEYWEVQDTLDGVVHVTRYGLITVWTVQVITD